MRDKEIDKRDDDIIVTLKKGKYVNKRYTTETPVNQGPNRSKKEYKRVKSAEKGKRSPIRNLGQSSAFDKGSGVKRKKTIKV
jgi:hypothetical protein